MSREALRNLTSGDFDGLTLGKPGVWLVDFGTAWCAPCRVLEPTLAALAAERAGELSIGRIDADEQGELTGRFGVVSMPTLLLFRDGRVIGQKVGAVPRAKIVAWLEENGALQRPAARPA